MILSCCVLMQGVISAYICMHIKRFIFLAVTWHPLCILEYFEFHWKLVGELSYLGTHLNIFFYDQDT